jgi:hypothetical protein
LLHILSVFLCSASLALSCLITPVEDSFGLVRELRLLTIAIPLFVVACYVVSYLVPSKFNVFDLLHLFVQSFVWIVSVVRLFGLI